MAEEKKQGWMRETEYLVTQVKANSIELAALKEDIRKLATIVRDLVYVEITESETEHKQALLDHQNALDEMIGGEDES